MRVAVAEPAPDPVAHRQRHQHYADRVRPDDRRGAEERRHQARRGDLGAEAGRSDDEDENLQVAERGHRGTRAIVGHRPAGLGYRGNRLTPRSNSTPTVLIARRLPAGRDGAARRQVCDQGWRPRADPGGAAGLVRGVDAIVADPTVVDRRGGAGGGRAATADRRQLRGRPRQRRHRCLPASRRRGHQHARRAHQRHRRAGAGVDAGRRAADERGGGRPAGRALARLGSLGPPGR